MNLWLNMQKKKLNDVFTDENPKSKVQLIYLDVEMSSIVNSGYPDNFKSVYFFFLRKDFGRTKTQHKRKSADKTKTS